MMLVFVEWGFGCWCQWKEALALVAVADRGEGESESLADAAGAGLPFEDKTKRTTKRRIHWLVAASKAVSQGSCRHGAPAG